MHKNMRMKGKITSETGEGPGIEFLGNMSKKSFVIRNLMQIAKILCRFALYIYLHKSYTVLHKSYADLHKYYADLHFIYICMNLMQICTLYIYICINLMPKYRNLMRICTLYIYLH